MKSKALFAKALLLKDKEILIIKFAMPNYANGELRLSNSVRFLDERRKETLKKVILAISDFVTEEIIQ